MSQVVNPFTKKIFSSIFPEVSSNELEEILLMCNNDAPKTTIEIRKRLKQRSNPSFLPSKNTVVQLYQEYEGECHYCKQPGAKSVAYGMNSDQMTVMDFQNLIESGWARCGKWIYLPSNHKVCCPTYAIRLHVDRFKPNKSQRRARNRLQRYLHTGSCKVNSIKNGKQTNHENINTNVSKILDNQLIYYKNEIEKTVKNIFRDNSDILTKSICQINTTPILFQGISGMKNSPSK